MLKVHKNPFHVFDGLPLDVYISTKRGGVSGGTYKGLNLATHVGDDSVKVDQNRLLFCEEVGCDVKQLILANQTHSTHVQIIDKTGLDLNETDGLITQCDNLVLGILTADCLPVVFFDRVNNVAAIVHAGWRGLVNGILENTLMLFQQKFSSQSKDLFVGIGPSISHKHFQVGEEVMDAFQSKFDFTLEYVNENRKMDLQGIAKRSLEGLGIKSEQIEVLPICTFSDDAYYSARREGVKSGRFITAVRLKKGV